MDVQTTTEAALTDSLAPPTFVITHLELFDWGSFAGRHSAQIDLEGTAIIGPTGSGKTTFVDALMTLITATRASDREAGAARASEAGGVGAGHRAAARETGA